MADEQEKKIPIDIHYDKLIDWLLARNKCKQNWIKEVNALRERINHALAELPMDIKSSLEGRNIDYFTVLQILEMLEKAEKDKTEGKALRGFFGGYTSEQLRAWDDIAKAYRKDNVFLAESGRIMGQNVNYEVPAMKKLIQSSDKQSSDMQKKIADCKRSSKEARKAFEDLCASYSIKGHDVRKELVASISALPKLLREVETTACEAKVLEALQYYRAFVSYTLQSGYEDSKKNRSEEFCATLSSVIESATKRAKQGGADEKEADLDSPVVVNGSDSGDNNGAAVEIDWDISIDSAGTEQAAPVEINWDISTESSGTADLSSSQSLAGDAPVSIDWGDLGDSTDSSAAVSAEPAAEAKIVAVKTDSPLEEPATRQLFLADLLELESFLQQRIRDFDATKTSAFTTQFSGAPTVVQVQSADSVESLLAAVQKVLSALRSPRIQQLLLFRASDRHIDRLTSSLKQRLLTAERMDITANDLEKRREELASTMEKTSVKLKAVVQATKTLQKQVEKALSEQYDGRVVNIFGDINTI